MVLYKNRVAHVVVVFFMLAGVALLAPASFADCFSPEWPHEKSELQPDPSLLFGRLDNGFRYVLKKNQEPKDRVAMSLAVQAGSLNESDEERGIAHFLEHMLFNGSTHFPPGKLVDYFQSIGMSFGGDTNAHTTYDETVYDIILPKGTNQDIEEGLLVFSDYARGALLLEEEIDRERGVILAEKRSRDSASYRAHVKGMEFSMKGTMIPERMPIGTLATLNKADHRLMKRFYDAWYRPENMVLVMVGDFEPKEVAPLVKKQFSGLTGAGPIPPCPGFGRLVDKDSGPDYYYNYDDELGTTETGIETLWDKVPQNDSFALQVEQLTAYVASRILQHRLDDLARKSDTPFTSARSYYGTFLDRITYGGLSAECDPLKWKESLTILENSLRQALDFGFTEEELQRVKSELLADMESSVLTANSRNSKKLAATLIRSINNNRVTQSPEQEQELFGPVLEKMDLVDVEKSFQQIWAHQRRQVTLDGNALIPEKDPLALIASVYNSAAKMKLAAYHQEILSPFPYLQLKDKKEPVSHKELPGIEGKRFVFANGVVLNLKATDFQENEVQISADFGLGKSSEPVPGLSMLSEAVVMQSGTATLNKDALDRVLAGSSVKMHFQIHPAAFSWQGNALNKDMELLFQVLHSLLADPGVDDEAFQVAMDRLGQHYESLNADVRGVMQLHGESFLAGGNAFFGLPPWSQFSQLSVEQIRQWVLPAARQGSLEISLVGDFDEQEVLRLAETYFSVLPERREEVMREVVVSFPKGEKLALTVPSSIDKGMLVVAWKTDDFWDIMRTRGLHVLAEIFSDKMRRVIREKLGASYSPQVYNVASRIYKGYGVMQAVLIVDPGQVDLLQKEVLKIAEEVWQGNISEKELAAAKAPMLTSLKDVVRSNRYWLKSVLALSSRYPQQLQWPATILSGFESFSVKDIQKLGRSYLDPKQAAVISVVPE
ncbi:MAG: insulinase family protein [Desulfocapsa sp.]|nr:insulinase family protein [Desulfocapsa sp.]